MSTHEPGIDMDYVNPGADKLKEVLSGHYHNIVDNVRILPVVEAKLVQDGLFSDDSLEAIIGPCITEAGKTLAVLKNLPRTTQDLYTFVNIIMPHYPHVAGPLKKGLDAVCLRSHLPTPVSEGANNTDVKTMHGSEVSDDTAVKVPCPQEPERNNTDLKTSNVPTTPAMPIELGSLWKVIAGHIKLQSAELEQKVEERLAQLDLEKAREEEKRVAEQKKMVEDMQALKKDYETANFRLDSKGKQLEYATKQLEHSRGDLQNAQNRLDESEKKNTYLTEQLEDATKQVEHSRGDLQNAQNRLDEAEKKNTYLTKQLEDATKQLEHSRGDLQNAQNRLDEAEKKIIYLKEQLKQKDHTIQEQADLINELEAKETQQTKTERREQQSQGNICVKICCCYIACE